MTKMTDLFEDVRDFPDPDAQERFAGLVGLDAVKARLTKEAHVLLDPSALENWSKQHHGQRLSLIHCFHGRAPLFVFAGDVGTGKTALAESFPDKVSREMDVPAKLYSLSLSARGTGAVGEMTSLLSAAFAHVRDAARKSVSSGRRPSCVHVLLIDEADALAQSRELAQMHHEDRAGVNALIRGIDELATGRLPVAVVMCTNRPEAIDPAVRRRAAEIFVFHRPNLDQRIALLTRCLDQTGMSSAQIHKLADATGETEGRSYGFTYSDLSQRFVPSLVLAAFPNRAVTFELAMTVLQSVSPTTPFTGESV
jgi:SpoVK/Ycf46/Vps4 family AAA+-type ATPase